MADDAETRGPIPPYGQAIWDAAKLGDLHEMEHIADAARLALAKGAKDEGCQIEDATSKAATHFHEVASHEAVEVRGALTELEKKIAELRHREQQPPGDTPAQ